MKKIEWQSLLAIPIILVIGTGIAWAGSRHGLVVAGLPLFAWCWILCLAINWLAFVPAYAFQTERFFDVCGSVTYVGVVAAALASRGDVDARSWVIGALVVLWASRLGSFLFLRIRRDGGDGRFDQIKRSLPRFAMTWTLQALWVFITIACGLAAMTSTVTRPLGGFAAAGILVWLVGFSVEVVADEQKRRFRKDPANRDRFIQTGIWAWSRHPNYFGEITLWVGVALIALPILRGWQWATLISPIFVYVLLTRISGVPLLAARAERKWGSDPDFVAYRAKTSKLVPRPPAAG